LTESCADLILESSAIRDAKYTLIDNAESEEVIVGCATIACKTRYSREGACLCMNIVVGRRPLHTFLESTVLSGNRQRRIKTCDDIRIAVSIAQKMNQKLWGDIVIQ
jgi:hypothetical protein